jgi:hypothetical protein
MMVVQRPSTNETTNSRMDVGKYSFIREKFVDGFLE